MGLQMVLGLRFGAGAGTSGAGAGAPAAPALATGLWCCRLAICTETVSYNLGFYM